MVGINQEDYFLKGGGLGDLVKKATSPQTFLLMDLSKSDEKELKILLHKYHICLS